MLLFIAGRGLPGQGQEPDGPPDDPREHPEEKVSQQGGLPRRHAADRDQLHHLQRRDRPAHHERAEAHGLRGGAVLRERGQAPEAREGHQPVARRQRSGKIESF